MTATPYTTSASVTFQVASDPTDVLAFYGESGSAQRASAAQGTITVTSTSTSPWGASSKAEMDALVAQVKEIASTLTALGLWKGSV